MLLNDNIIARAPSTITGVRKCVVFAHKIHMQIPDKNQSLFTIKWKFINTIHFIHFIDFFATNITLHKKILSIKRTYHTNYGEMSMFLNKYIDIERNTTSHLVIRISYWHLEFIVHIFGCDLRFAVVKICAVYRESCLQKKRKEKDFSIVPASWYIVLTPHLTIVRLIDNTKQRPKRCTRLRTYKPCGSHTSEFRNAWFDASQTELFVWIMWIQFTQHVFVTMCCLGCEPIGAMNFQDWFDDLQNQAQQIITLHIYTHSYNRSGIE